MSPVLRDHRQSGHQLIGEVRTVMQALRYQTRIHRGGKIVLPPVRLTSGTPVEVIVLLPGDGDEVDLTTASETSLGFWDNPIDDRVWNDA